MNLTTAVALESEELNRKIHNLEVFLHNDNSLIGVPRDLMELQFNIMCDYHDVLMQRLEIMQETNGSTNT